MTTAEKLVIVAENQQRVYEAGYAKGIAVGGGDDYYDRFWDAFQAEGERVNYQYAFAYDRFNDETYNPKYPINTKSGSTPCRYAFYQAKGITDTKVPIYANASNCDYMFGQCDALETIRELRVLETQSFTETFNWCNVLKNVVFTGTIGKSINLSYSPLTPESMKSVISCLKNYSGTSSELVNTISFTGACWAALEADSTAPDGGTWEEYVYNLGWNT